MSRSNQAIPASLEVVFPRAVQLPIVRFLLSGPLNNDLGGGYTDQQLVIPYDETPYNTGNVQRSRQRDIALGGVCRVGGLVYFGGPRREDSEPDRLYRGAFFTVDAIDRSVSLGATFRLIIPKEVSSAEFIRRWGVGERYATSLSEMVTASSVAVEMLKPDVEPGDKYNSSEDYDTVYAVGPGTKMRRGASNYGFARSVLSRVSQALANQEKSGYM
ncbi:hypothetical protein JNM87_05855 [Candidatus Saccharibacteria bacterium]|nr:hypothetical protein [Candidatus Saccharibacteria bacterium]